MCQEENVSWNWAQLSKCLMRGGELGVDKYLLGSDALLKRSALLCGLPLNSFFFLFLPPFETVEREPHPRPGQMRGVRRRFDE